jgi:excisionase family DNA binding protein
VVARSPLAKAGPRAPPHAPAPVPVPEVLTADELAALLRVNRKTVYAGFKAGEIPGGKRIGGTIRFSRDAVLRWLAEGQVSRSSRGK